MAGCVDVANPPEESRLHLRVARVIFLLHRSHPVKSVRRGQVGVDDAVPKTGMRLLLLDQRIGIDDPIDGAVAHRMGADWDAILMKETDHFLINRGICLRVAAVALP